VRDDAWTAVVVGHAIQFPPLQPGLGEPVIQLSRGFEASLELTSNPQLPSVARRIGGWWLGKEKNAGLCVPNSVVHDQLARS
jgi:hypothetical protein